jgi:hypothetical protein
LRGREFVGEPERVEHDSEPRIEEPFKSEHRNAHGVNTSKAGICDSTSYHLHAYPASQTCTYATGEGLYNAALRKHSGEVNDAKAALGVEPGLSKTETTKWI